MLKVGSVTTMLPFGRTFTVVPNVPLPAGPAMSDWANGPDGANSVSGGVIRVLRCADNGWPTGSANNKIELTATTVRKKRIPRRRVADNDDIGEKTPCNYSPRNQVV